MPPKLTEFLKFYKKTINKFLCKQLMSLEESNWIYTVQGFTVFYIELNKLIFQICPDLVGKSFFWSSYSP